jgi:hypothetical protein
VEGVRFADAGIRAKTGTSTNLRTAPRSLFIFQFHLIWVFNGCVSSINSEISQYNGTNRSRFCKELHALLKWKRATY